MRAIALLVLLAGCSTNASPSSTTSPDASPSDASPFDAGPNEVPGQCVLSDGVWYCGAPYGDIPTCGVEMPTGACTDVDAASCFVCAYANAAGAVCQCGGPDGGKDWYCLPSGTGCHQP